MPPRFDVWKLAAAHFAIVSFLFVAAGITSIWSRGAMDARLITRQTDTIGVEDVLTSTRSGNLGAAGIVLLVLIGPAAEVFQGSIALIVTAMLLFIVATALHLHLRHAALAGIAWAFVVLAFLLVALEQISVSYSYTARILMFCPAAIWNIMLLIALCRRCIKFPHKT